MTCPQPHRLLKRKDNYPIHSFARFFLFFYPFGMAADASVITAAPVRTFIQKTAMQLLNPFDVLGSMPPGSDIHWPRVSGYGYKI